MQVSSHADLEWAGVPWDTAASVSGLKTGMTYQLGVYVTGYVMTDTDAYQRTFTVTGDEIQVEVDLRRSNWFVVQPHTITPFHDMGLGMLVQDDAGNNKGLAAFDVPAGTHGSTNHNRGLERSNILLA